MWDGSLTLGDFWSAYVGPTDQNTPHAHVAVQLAIGTHGNVVVDTGRRRVEARGVLIRPLATHTVGPGRQVAFLWVEPQASLGRAFLRMLDGRGTLVVPHELLAVTSELVDPRVLMDRLATTLGIEHRPPLDARLTRVLQALEYASGEPGVVRTAALQSGLSPSRARALAKEQLGAPLSRWLLWRKLERAGRALATGSSLVDAAAAGGFADQAHFARTMRRMFGVTPSIAATALR